MFVRRFTFADLVSWMINFIFGLIILSLFLRLLLKLFGANPNTPFVQFIHNSTTPLLQPFNNIFNPVVLDTGNILESSTLVAIIFYLLVAYIIDSFIDFIDYSSRRYRA